MPELRKDIVTGEWVIIAVERAKRPEDFSGGSKNVSAEPIPENKPGCPFCEGNEALTPPEIEAFRCDGTNADTSGWSVRTIPNKFPALTCGGKAIFGTMGIYTTMSGVGAHEVIVETPNHTKSPALLEKGELEKVIHMYQDRYMDLAKDDNLEYIQIFRNHGKTAGASMEHPHSQIIATPIIPNLVNDTLRVAQEYYKENRKCVICDVLSEETSDGRRIVFENMSFVAFEPYASKSPFETWIVPKMHSARFEVLSNQEITDLAEAMKLTLKAIYDGLNDPAYNFVIFTSPVKSSSGEEEYIHWRMKIVPKLTIAAGFEIGTGIYINSATPEDTAMFLKEQIQRIKV